MVMLNGRLFDAMTLRELAGRDRWAARPPMYFEEQ